MAAYFDIAKPYAKAAFAYAKEQAQLPAWQDFLSAAAHVASHPGMLNYLKHPRLSKEERSELFFAVCTAQQGNAFISAYKNFLHLLSHHDRLLVLPDIAQLFNVAYAHLRRVATAQVMTAVPIEAAYEQQLSLLLSKRIGCDVVLHCTTDPAILGGAIIYLGDHVIDASIRGRLTRLREFFLR